MNKVVLEDFICTYLENAADNHVSADKALDESLIGMKMYEQPLIAYASAKDPLFSEFAAHEKFAGLYKLPTEWLDSAQTVISIFLPFTDIVKKSNAQITPDPSKEWLHARIEGQAFIAHLTKDIVDMLQAAGFEAVAPCISTDFVSLSSQQKTKPELTQKYPTLSFTSNWSERHAAYAAGLGTFCLSKGLITKKGVAGRFTSIITNMPLEATAREYSKVDEYCTMCGACVRNCPAQAISLSTGKSHPICAVFLDEMLEKYHPRYGCGKCQVHVPCESMAPGLLVKNKSK